MLDLVNVRNDKSTFPDMGSTLSFPCLAAILNFKIVGTIPRGAPLALTWCLTVTVALFSVKYTPGLKVPFGPRVYLVESSGVITIG